MEDGDAERFAKGLSLSRYRIICDLQAICQACGSELTYVEESRALKVRSQR